VFEEGDEGPRRAVCWDAQEHDFSGALSGGAAAAVPLTDGKLNLTIVVDGYSVEVFAGDGKVVLSTLVFPPAGDDKVAVFSGGGKATAENLSVTKLTSTT